ncbi:ABC transporter substrate-binding protein [Paraburkholderia rhizosphaerae]|uniref:Amino acid ABC transporter substrate-binding protein (PAAT family) n=1 Tax=Paraburkholderia rhizosphaerae TaxID=480658 RepID=A0A4R8LVG8_9BURK|nr:ABC transporter substrate-binding protein [Paraburkholderia rhizosphaerae]TDY51578.1 amino acid ABC transporter substrate-binding protein (PAAT family) [Paraburkholderia rhizosphaerae]
MKPGIKKTLLLLAMALGAINAHAKEWKDIRIGYEGAYPPFSSMQPDGQPVGFDIDMIHALCAQMHANCTLVQLSWDGLIPALQAEKIDAIVASVAITAERKQKVAFTEKYYNTPRRLVVAKNSPIKDATPAELKGKRVGVQRGTLGDKYATAYWVPNGVQLVRYATQDEVFLDLRSGRIDAALQDATAAYSGFLTKPEGANYQFVGGPIVGTTPEQKTLLGEGYGIPVRKSDDDLRLQLNQAIDAIRANGVYQSIEKKYFNFDIY